MFLSLSESEATSTRQACELAAHVAALMKRRKRSVDPEERHDCLAEARRVHSVVGADPRLAERYRAALARLLDAKEIKP